MNDAHTYSVHALKDHTVSPYADGLRFRVGLGELRGSSHLLELTVDDSRWFPGTPLSEGAMMNERAPVGLSVYLDLLFLTQFLHKEPDLKCLSIKTQPYQTTIRHRGLSPSFFFFFLFPLIQQKSLIVLHCGTWDWELFRTSSEGQPTVAGFPVH